MIKPMRIFKCLSAVVETVVIRERIPVAEYAVREGNREGNKSDPVALKPLKFSVSTNAAIFRKFRNGYVVQ